MKKILTMLSLLFSLSVSASSQTVQNDAAIQQTILEFINNYRAQHHRPPLKLVPLISLQAQQHSIEMAQKKMSFGHQGFNKRIDVLYKKIKLCRGGAENIAYMKISAREVAKRWTESPGHRANILGNYNLTGIGIARIQGGWIYYTQMFIRSDDPAYAGRG
ncbi:putative transporter [Legionella birminghamensis]|uniref:Transporter n=1 Tax=Legionella birminghamensis TaxID=28083 RepID=A0A378I9R7_9GAMM|nr:CAP domain-containing protein [Legionella birminghamensis]KTC69310.1 putative transporter [Legionella birminghamensis]STX31572.1 putative transporter [Legionella birminghamensis]